MGWSIVLSKSLHLELLCNRQEGVELLLGNIDFSMVHEVQHRLKLTEPNTLEVEQRVLVRILLENGSEEWRASRQDELVCLDLSGATAKSAVKQILLFSDLPEG